MKRWSAVGCSSGVSCRCRSSSSSSSVDGISETSSSFDVVGVGGTKANTAIEANGSLSSDVDFDLSSTAESTHSDSAVVIGGEQLSGSDFEQINVGGNWVASSDVAGVLLVQRSLLLETLM